MPARTQPSASGRIASSAGRSAGYPIPFATTYGECRLVGPIFAGNLRGTTRSPVSMPIYPLCFSAVEAEYVFELAHDAGDATDWTAQSVGDIIANVRLGIEIASSPLATINDLGPTVITSDFGNNAGLVVGPPFGDWRSALQSARNASACSMAWSSARAARPPFPAVRWPAWPSRCRAATRAAARALRAGELVTTGAATGVHPVRPGQMAMARFGAAGEISRRLVAAQPRLVARG